MGVFVSPNEYVMFQNDCEQVSFNICGHEYKVWCKNEKKEQVFELVEKIKPFIQKTATNNTGFSFDKIMFLSIIEFLSKDKKLVDEIREQNELQKKQQSTPEIVNFEKEKQELVDDFVKILEAVLNNL